MPDSDKSKETVKVEASDLVAVEQPTAETPSETKVLKQKTYTVHDNGNVYKIQADSIPEVLEKFDGILEAKKKAKKKDK